jgi:hypothetical protein
MTGGMTKKRHAHGGASKPEEAKQSGKTAG